MKRNRIGLPVVAGLLAIVAASAFFVLGSRDAQEPLVDDRPATAPLVAEKEGGEAPRTLREPPAATETSLADSNRSEADAREVVIHVVDPEHTSVAGAKLVLFREGMVLGQALTASDGLARFSELDGRAEYAIATPGWEIARGELELGTGQRTLALPEGATVGGSVTVDGGVPPESFELHWASSSAPVAQALPPAVHKALRGARSQAIATVLTNPNGDFAFRGIRPGTRGSLRWEAPYFLEDLEHAFSSQDVDVEEPRRDLLLSLTEGCVLRLRVVDSEGAPVPYAEITFRREVVKETSSRSSTKGGKADAEGRYSESLLADAVETFAVSVAAPGSTTSRAHILIPPPLLRGQWDAGDLAIPATRRVTVIVQDPEARPVPNASAYAWPAPYDPNRRKTVNDGRIEVAISEEAPSIAIEAFGYVSALVDVAPEASEITATLERSCLLEFVLEGRAVDHEGLTLELTGPTPMFIDKEEYGVPSTTPSRPRTPRLTGGGMDMTTSETETRLKLHATKDKRWRLSGLVANQPLHAKLMGSGDGLCDVEIAGLGPAEHRTVPLKVDQPGKALRLRVLTPEGAPCGGARIYNLAGVDRENRTTDAQGEVELKSLFGDKCILSVQSDAYAPKRVLLQPIPAGPYEVVLEPAQSVEIELVDPAGAPYTGPVDFQVTLGGFSPARKSTLAPGRFRVDGLPRGDVVLDIRTGVGSISRLMRAGDPSLRVVVGGPGTLQARVTGQPDVEGVWVISVTPAGAPRELTRAAIRLSKEGKASPRLASLVFGSYDVCLLRCSDPVYDDWARVGDVQRVTIDAEHPNPTVELMMQD